MAKKVTKKQPDAFRALYEKDRNELLAEIRYLKNRVNKLEDYARRISNNYKFE